MKTFDCEAAGTGFHASWIETMGVIGSNGNTVRLSLGRYVPQAVPASELFVAIDPTQDVAYAVHDERGALRWTEVTRSDAELLVTMGARARIELGSPRTASTR